MQAQCCHINVILAHRERSTGTAAAARKTTQQSVNPQLCAGFSSAHSGPVNAAAAADDGDDDDDGGEWCGEKKQTGG